MINKKRKHNNLTISVIILTSFLLVISMYIFYNYKYLYDLHIFFKNIGANIENVFTIKISESSNNLLIGIDDELLKENMDLKEMLDLKKNNYDMLTCSVIARDITWYNTLTINKGKKSNLDVGIAVVDKNGLIGRISEVGNDYSVVELITNKNFTKIAVDIKGLEENHGILDSYNANDNELIIKNVNKNSNISISDKVYTNGLGGIYPAGLYIGEVVSIEKDNLDLSKVLKVKISADFDNIRYVNVIRR